MKTDLVILSILILSATLQAQNPIYTKIDKVNGLLSNTIYDLMQDKNGFIWIAHDKGLSKYDGFRFIHYQDKEQRGKSLSNLLQDKYGKIWCQNFIGQVFYTENDSLHLCNSIEPTGTFSPAAILNEEILIVPGKSGLRYTNTHTKQTEQISLPGYSSNHYGISFENKYYFFNKETHLLFILHPEKTIDQQQVPKDISYFYAIPTHSGIHYLPKYPLEHTPIPTDYAQKISFYLPKTTFIQNIKVINDSIIAACTTKGLLLFNHNLTPAYSQIPVLEEKNISIAIQDQEKNWWIGTLNEGILFIPDLDNKTKFETFSFTAIQPAANKNSLYLGTSNNELWEYQTHNGKLVNRKTLSLKQEVGAIHYDIKNDVVAFSSDQFYAIHKNKTITHSGAIKDILQLDENYYAVGASGFVALYNIHHNQPSNKWQQAYKEFGGHYLYPDKTEFRLNNKELRVRALTTHHDTIFAATTNGLIAFTLQGPIELKYKGKSIYISDLETYNNTVYASTINYGLLKLIDGKLVSCLNITGNDLPVIYKIKGYDGKIWALTESNLYTYSINTGDFLKFDRSDRLPVDDFNDFGIMQDTVYLIGSKGLIYFSTKVARPPAHVPRLIINSLLVNQKNKQSTNKLLLTSNENDIRIHYSVIDYRGSNTIRAYYQIDKSNWQIIDNTTRELHLASLAPGTYNVALKAVNEKGEESPIKTITFTILSPFYQQPWFILLLISLLIIALYLWHQKRLQKIEQDNKIATDKIKLEQELQQSLLASIKAQMNPHFIFNSLSTIQSFVYTDDKANAIKYLDQFSELTRKVLELSNHETILLSEEITLLDTYISLEKMRFGDSLHFSITCEDSIDIHYVRLPSMIIQPFVENAIKHGLLHRKGEKQLYITFTQRNKDLVITIEDNGVGRKTSAGLKQTKNRKHQSFSISANQKRLDLLNSKRQNTIGLTITDKEDELGRGIGTTVCITIPLGVS